MPQIVCSRLSLALRLKNRGCLVAELALLRESAGLRMCFNDARALFLSVVRKRPNHDGEGRFALT